MATSNHRSSNALSLRELLETQLQDLLDAELQLAGYLPQLPTLASSRALTERLEGLHRQAENAVTHLTHACTLLGLEAGAVPCEAMKGLIREAREHLGEKMEPAAMDAAIISQLQRIAHYEIAGFGTAREFARCLNLSELREICEDLRDAAAEADRSLTRLAVGGWVSRGINDEAANSAA